MKTVANRPPMTGEPDWTLKVPGRLNLIGEHTDYNGGQVLPFAIDAHLLMKVHEIELEPNEAPWAEIRSDCIEPIIHLDWKQVQAWAKEEPAQAAKNHPFQENWGIWPIGTLYALMQKNITEPKIAIKVQIISNLPSGAGISSSAALASGLLKIFSRWNNISINDNELAIFAMKTEHHFAGTLCGLMDQLAVIQSEKGSLLHIDFLSYPPKQEWQTRKIKLHQRYQSYQLLAFNTGVKHVLSDSPYNERRKACENAVKVLNKILKVNHDSLGAYSKHFQQYWPNIKDQKTFKNWLSEYFDELSAGCAAHGIFENFRVELACHALQSGDLDKLDKLMIESHNSLDQDFQVSCQELNLACKVVKETASNLASKQQQNSDKINGLPPVLGPRMTGGGFGGSTIQWVRKDLVKDLLDNLKQLENPYTEATGITPKILKTILGRGIHYL